MARSTADTIVEAALATLKEEGFAGASSRAIARRGGFNQALVFYHHGSVERLLLEALERTSNERLARYRETLADVRTLEELVARAGELDEEDKSSGHMRVVAQMVAGSVNRPELARAVLARMEPWIAFAEETLARVLPDGLPVRELAYALVTFYLGVNLLAHLDPTDTRTDALFRAGRELVPLAGLVPSASAGSRGRPARSTGPASAR
jgi:AcrR family transcriptional regulator